MKIDKKTKAPFMRKREPLSINQPKPIILNDVIVVLFYQS
jgi:hypothetical protein